MSILSVNMQQSFGKESVKCLCVAISFSYSRSFDQQKILVNVRAAVTFGMK